ncbi:MAG: imidazolonepropionase-like amidohydrolase [Candidatus Aldehydirespiratoraceae bacterium]|jgi:imidazolonepropionase-like amidohydrolase
MSDLAPSATSLTRTVIRNSTVLDTATMTYSEGQTVVIDDGTIVDVAPTYAGDAAIDIDAGGRYVLPGLIDGHVHFRLATLNFHALSQWSEVQFGIAMATLSKATVERGFTTVRDLGGEVNGLMRAIESGAASGPRIVRAGLMLTQTGGHGDVRSGEIEVASCGCALDSNVMSIVADGCDAVRKAARHLLRDGSDFLKIHVSGGVASPSDPLESVQYTPEEIRTVVTEARHRGTYVAAHAYTPEAIVMAVNEGVHSIEHGNLMDDSTAKLLADSGTIVVPTLVTYKAMDDIGRQLGLPEANLAKNTVVLESGLESLERAHAAGVTLGFGTDLIGEAQPRQNEELAIRGSVQPARDVLRSMWGVNPQLCHLDGKIGVVAPGAFGDIVISNVDPLEDLAAFAQHETALAQVIQGGKVVVDRTGH